MKISKKKILETVRQVLREGETITIPAPTKTPDIIPAPTKRPNPLMPPKEAPKPRPKALFNEDEITDKIIKRFQSLKESKKKTGKLVGSIRQIISEISIEQLKQQFVDTKKLTKEVFDEIVRVTNAKGAYATWMVKRVEDGTIKPEDIYKYEDYIETFNRYKKQFPFSDINAYRKEEEVRAFEEKAIEIREKDIEQTGGDIENQANLVSLEGIEELKAAGINFLGTVDGYQSFEIPSNLIGSEKAYKAYVKHLANCSGRDQGAKIRLCTMASKDNFNHYLKKGDLYVFYNLGDPKSPYQFNYEADQFMDKDNKRLF